MAKNLLLSERQIIRVMRDLYYKRLLETMREADVVDDDGNIIITQDLKVRHKDSQYEYTVDDIINDPATGEIMIALRLPDEPRFDPSPKGDGLLSDQKKDPSVLGEDELMNPNPQEDMMISSKSDEEIFVIDQEEFEKEYEVK